MTHGIIGGLVVGKLAGIGLASTLAVRFGLGRLPSRGAEVWGGAALAGIGFTISLFVVDLAFESPALQEEARLGVLCASVLAALTGWAVFAVDRRFAGDDDGAPIIELAAPVDPDSDHIRGPVDAPLTLVEYGDFECEFCGRTTGVIEALRERLGDDLRYVFRHLPLPEVHPRAELAAEAAEAAATQGAFWEMHDRLYANQDKLAPDDLIDHAAALGLDVVRIARELGDGEHAKRVRDDVASAQASGAAGTPTLYVNGNRVFGRYDADALAAALTAGRAGGEAMSEPPGAGADARAGLPVVGRLRDGDPSPARELELEGLEETPDNGAFPRLTSEQIATLDPHGQRRRLERDEPLFGAGETSADFVVVLSGAVAMVDGFGRQNRVGIVHGQGRFLGELGILSGQATLFTAVAQRSSDVLTVPAARLDQALAGDPALREVVLRSFLLRRSVLLDLNVELRLIGFGSSSTARRLRDFAARHEVPYSWTDLDNEDERVAWILDRLGVDRAETPVAVVRGGDVLRDPSEAELGRALGIEEAALTEDSPERRETL